ncbi:DoxX family protein [Desertibaculum subflavum]|uniref:DoxX family protein n=1 Tax=Desertibaculum subflavum TaxID=2268458 RepID=UPI0034D34416
MMNDAAMASRRSGITGAIGRLYAGLEAFPLSVIEVLMRIGGGAVFFKSGLTKIANMEITVDLFREEYKVPLLAPEIAAPLATAAELTAPVLLVLGLLTRPAAAALLGMTAVIQLFVYPANWSEHLLWASILIYLVTRGPGTLSVDHLARKSLG